jgi:uncharacterized protein YjaG (DUF416 family)
MSDRDTRLAALAQLGARGKAAFAAACAQRLLPLYDEYVRRTGGGDLAAVHSGLDALWEELLSPGTGVDFGGLADELEELVPDTVDGPWDDYSGVAEDAIAAVVFAMWEYTGRDPSSVVWAAERALEAIEQQLDDEALASDADPQVVAEVARQRRDAAELAAAEQAGDLVPAVRAVRERSTGEPITPPNIHA